jgi:hypothetical protein
MFSKYGLKSLLSSFIVLQVTLGPFFYSTLSLGMVQIQKQREAWKIPSMWSCDDVRVQFDKNYVFCYFYFPMYLVYHFINEADNML